MAGILVDGKIRFGMLCFSVSLFYSLPSIGASSQPLTELQISSEPVVVSSESNSSNEKAADKSETPHLIYSGTKESHEPATGKLPPRPRDSMDKHRNPINISTGTELLPTPVEPKR